MFRRLVPYLWKVPLCALAYVAGTVVSGAVLSMLSVEPLEMPADVDEQALAWPLLIGSVVLSLAVAPLARRICVGYADRCLILAAFVYVCLSVNNAIEASIYTTWDAAASTPVYLLLPCVLLAATSAGLFPPRGAPESFSSRRNAFFAGRRPRQWAWRIAAAVLAFPAVYFLFGMPVGVLVADAYRQQSFGLMLPSLGVIISVQLIRSALYLIASLPVLIAYSGSRRGLVLVFGLALFVLTGLFGMIQAVWLPMQLRVVHSVELLADSLVYAWALAALLWIAPREGPAA